MEKTGIMGDILDVLADRDRDANADGYPDFLESIQNNFERPGKLFRTDAVGLFGAFLAGLPKGARQHYNCRTCQKFVDDFGGLVRIDQFIDDFGGLVRIDSVHVSALWGDGLGSEVGTPKFFRQSVLNMMKLIDRANITGVFFSDEWVLGWVKKGGFHHMATTILPGNENLSPDRTSTARQLEAEKAEDFLSLCRALEEYSLETVQTAGQVLTSGHLYRSEKAKARVDWLLGLKLQIMETKNRKLQNNMIWAAVASAPAGWCHVKSSIVGSLLDDIKSGMSFVTIQNRWEMKLDPTRYLRPQAAPDAGNIQQAEKVVTDWELE